MITDLNQYLISEKINFIEAALFAAQAVKDQENNLVLPEYALVVFDYDQLKGILRIGCLDCKDEPEDFDYELDLETVFTSWASLTLEALQDVEKLAFYSGNMKWLEDITDSKISCLYPDCTF
jgi:hypothetical protein